MVASGLYSLQNPLVLSGRSTGQWPNTWSHKNEIEYGEKTQLKIESTIVHLPEGKPTEESSKNMKDDFIPHIILESRISKTIRQQHVS